MIFMPPPTPNWLPGESQDDYTEKLRKQQVADTPDIVRHITVVIVATVAMFVIGVVAMVALVVRIATL